MTRRPRPNRLSQDGRALALARALALVGDLRVSVSEVVVRNPSDAAKGLNKNVSAVVVVDDDQ